MYPIPGAGDMRPSMVTIVRNGEKISVVLVLITSIQARGC